MGCEQRCPNQQHGKRSTKKKFNYSAFEANSLTAAPDYPMRVPSTYDLGPGEKVPNTRIRLTRSPSSDSGRNNVSSSEKRPFGVT